MVKIYLVWNPINTLIMEKQGLDTNILASYYFLKDIKEESILRLITAKDFILDSGAFSAYSTNTKIYLEDYINFIKKYKIEKYFNLDVIGDAEATLKNQKKMEEAGLKPIPVFHYGTDEKYLESLKKYDYIALGGLVPYSQQKRKLLIWILNIQKKINSRLHLFGITNEKILKIVKPYSTDSSSWASGGRFGIVYYFNGKQIKQLKRKIKNNTKTNQKLHEWNYIQWKQYVKYMEEKENAA